MKHIFFLSVFFPLSLFSQIQVLDELYNSLATGCYHALDGDILVLNNEFDIWIDGRAKITEFNNNLEEERKFDFSQTNYSLAEISHILPRISNNDYLVSFTNYSDNQSLYYFYTASLSANLDELIVLDSVGLGVDAGFSSAQGLEIGGFIEYYFTIFDVFFSYFIRVDTNTGEITDAGEHIVYNNGNPVNLLQIRDVGETATHKLLTNSRSIHFIDKNQEISSYDSLLGWFLSNGNITSMYKLNFEFTEDNEYLVVSGETSKANESGRFYTLGRIRFDELETGLNKPENLMVYDENSYGAAINSLFKNEETGEIWAVGSTSDIRYLTDDFPSDFPTTIIVDKFDKNGEHLFQVELLSNEHIYPWNAVTTSDGGLAIVGSNYDFEELLYYRGFIMKLTANGELLPTSTASIIEADQLSIFPNPTSGNIQIKVPNGNNEYSFTILNNLGQTILTKNGVSSDTELALDQFPEGLYYVHIVDQDGAIQIEKIIKQ